MILTNLKKARVPSPNILNEEWIKEKIRIDDDFTFNLQVKELPIDIQLMLVPMWTLRSDYHDCMTPLDDAMTSYMNSRDGLLKVDRNLDMGTATNREVAAAFDHVLTLMGFYERNQTDLLRLFQKGSHQLVFYSRATRDDRMWDEMMKLKDIDYLSYTQKTCCFEHVTMSLFKLVESIRDSLQTSQDISKCCANYLIRISKHFNFPDPPAHCYPDPFFADDELNDEILLPIGRPHSMDVLALELGLEPEE